jgi:hypothetical protein
MSSPSEGDSFLKCTECGREDRTNFSHSLRHGWPKCCGYTMRLERTEADIGAAVGDAMAPLQTVRKAARDA